MSYFNKPTSMPNIVLTAKLCKSKKKKKRFVCLKCISQTITDGTKNKNNQINNNLIFQQILTIATLQFKPQVKKRMTGSSLSD